MSSNTSWEEVYANTVVAVIILDTGEHVRIVTNVYDKLHAGGKFRSPKGTVFSLKNVVKIIPIDDYKTPDK